MIPLNQIICGDNTSVLADFPANCIDLVVTSPPYDDITQGENGELITTKNGLRQYNGYHWDFSDLSGQLHRVLKPGGVMVWVVADRTVNGSETGSSFRQALHFMELGFSLYDTMIYHRIGLPMTHRRYEQNFEYMFVFSKGTPKTFNPIMINTAYAGSKKGFPDNPVRPPESGGLYKMGKQWTIGSKRIAGNVWKYAVGFSQSTDDREAFKHSATFPEKLASDHILSWSNPGDVVLDPFVGSGTVAKMAFVLDRSYIGIEISQEYVNIAENRLSRVKLQPKLIPFEVENA